MGRTSASRTSTDSVFRRDAPSHLPVSARSVLVGTRSLTARTYKSVILNVLRCLHTYPSRNTIRFMTRTGQSSTVCQHAPRYSGCPDGEVALHTQGPAPRRFCRVCAPDTAASGVGMSCPPLASQFQCLEGHPTKWALRDLRLEPARSHTSGTDSCRLPVRHNKKGTP